MDLPKKLQDTTLLIWVWSVSNIKTHIWPTKLFLENKNLIKGVKKILTFHSLQNIYFKCSCVLVTVVYMIPKDNSQTSIPHTKYIL